MSANTPTTERDPFTWLYWAAGGVALLLVVIGLITYSHEKDTAQAQQKAQQLTQKLEAAGLRAPEDQDILIRALGTDGGAVCDNPGRSLGRAVLFDQLTNGGAFVGRRPVIVDGDILKGEALILQTYCPDQLPQYQDKIDDLKTDDVLKN
jgi:hypothetical protein